MIETEEVVPRAAVERGLDPLFFDGYCFFVRKCKTVSKVGLIEMPETVQERCLFVEVKAIGHMAQGRCSKDHAKYYRRSIKDHRNIAAYNKDIEPLLYPNNDDINVGTILLIPDGNFAGIKNGQFNDVEYYIESGLPLAIRNEDETLRLLADRVLVRPIDDPEEKKGIFLPQSVRDKPKMGQVVGLGTGVKDADGNLRPFRVKKGDLVVLSKLGGWFDTRIKGEKFYIIREGEILARHVS